MVSLGKPNPPPTMAKEGRNPSRKRISWRGTSQEADEKRRGDRENEIERKR